MEESRILEEIAALKLEIINLKEEIAVIKEETAGGGVYLDGTPEYVRKYMADKRAKDKANGGI